VVLFGSTIRPAPSSFDFDCLYIYEVDKPALHPAPMDVDLRGYPADQVEDLIGQGHDLLIWSLRLGELVCEHNAYWTKLKASWQGRLPFPSAEVAVKRATAADRMAKALTEAGDHDAAAEQSLTAITHRARAALILASVFPASRPELPDQLRSIGRWDLAMDLARAIADRDLAASGEE